MFDKKRDHDDTRRRKDEELQSSLSAPPPEMEGGTVVLLDRMRSGDREAGNELVLRYQERLERFVQLKMVGLSRGSGVEDIVQDAYIKLFQGLERFEYRGKDSVYAYLMRVAVNLIISEKRRHGNKPGVGGEEADDLFTRIVKEQPSPVSIAGQSELRRILDETLLQLPEDQRHALLYRVVLGVPSKIASQWMDLKDEATFDHLVSRSKMKWLQIAEPRLKEWRERT